MPERAVEADDVPRPGGVGVEGTRRVLLGAVDVRPGRRVQDEVERAQVGGRGLGDVPLRPRERDDVLVGELLGQRLPELAAGAGDQEAAAASRADRIGDCVLQRSRTRGSDVRSQRPGTTITVAIVIAIETAEVIASRRQLSAVDKRQMSDVTTP